MGMGNGEGARETHPYVQRKHVFVLTDEDLVTDLHDQPEPLIVEPLSGVVRPSERCV